MVLYDKKLLQEIQECINLDEFKVDHCSSFSDFNMINIANIKLMFTESPSTGRDVMMNITDTDINADYIKKWKATAPGKFLIKDWKRNVTDRTGGIPYYYLTFNLNNVCYIAIIRNLIELNDMLSEDERKMFITQYGNLNIDSRYYAVIKINKNSDNVDWRGKDAFFYKEDSKAEENECSAIIELPLEEEPTLESLENKIEVNSVF